MPRLKRNDVIELQISDLALTGKSIGRHDGMVVMADQGLPGETIECRVIQVKRNYAFGRQLRLLKPSTIRVEPRCSHFSHCGGCTWQNLSYADQLQYKASFVTEALERIGKLAELTIDSAVAAVEPFFYRNKMEYSFGSNDDQASAAGLHFRGRFDAVFEMTECYLQSEQSVDALETVREIARSLAIPFFHFDTEEGELRFLIVREGKLTDEMMLNIVTFHRKFDNRDSFFRRIIEKVKGVTSLYHTVNGRKAHVAVGEELVHVWGKTYLTEKIGDLSFRITPFSFFQTNSKQSKLLYDVIKDHAEPKGTDQLLDLFCGCGSIGLYLASAIESVLGIEINEEAIEMAKVNAELNGITNASFMAGDVRKILAELRDRKFDTIITDPPRAGMEQKAVTRIARLQPRRIVAVSCNPATLARDLSLFAEAGYRAVRVTPVDMFPQTAHVECVTTLLPNDSVV